MKKRFAVVALVLASTPLAAFAGFTSDPPVQIALSISIAAGSLGTARNAPDSSQRIGCTIFSYPRAPESAACTAKTASGVEASCVTEDPLMVNAIGRLNGDSYLWFMWNEEGECTYLQINNDSRYAPKAP